MQLLKLIVVILILVSLSVNVSALSVSPAELRVSSAIGKGRSGDFWAAHYKDMPRHISINIEKPSNAPGEEKHLRAICNNCNERMQRYETINGTNCMYCGSDDMIFYEEIPRVQYIHLENTKYGLEYLGSGRYITKEKVPPKTKLIVNITLDIPSQEDYNHWEAHIVISVAKEEDGGGGVGMTSGVAIRMLIDAPPTPSSILPLVAGIIICVVFIGAIAYYFKSGSSSKSDNKRKIL